MTGQHSETSTKPYLLMWSNWQATWSWDTTLLLVAEQLNVALQKWKGMKLYKFSKEKINNICCIII